MADELSEITTPIQFDKVGAKDVMAAIGAGGVAFRPMIKAICANDAEAAGENHWVFG
jgi:hypothetical protein